MNASPDPRPTPNPRAEDLDGLSLGDYLALFWQGRYWIAGATALALAAGAGYAWLATPIYKVDAMIQVEPKKAGKGNAALATMMEGLVEVATEAQAEVEILQSNLVLGRAVEALRLDLVAEPKLAPVVGQALQRGKKDAPRLDVETFEIPNGLRGETFGLVLQAGGAFTLEDPFGQVLAQGKVGAETAASCAGQALKLKLRDVQGRPGQRFTLLRKPMRTATQDLRDNLSVAERGKQTNIIGLALTHPRPAEAAEVLNAILDQYIRQNIERKAEEANKTLGFLQEQLPLMKGRLEVAEEKFNGFRAGRGAVDLSEEAKVVLQKSSQIEAETIGLRQKKDELLRTYQTGSDVVQTLDQQIARLQGETRKLEGTAQNLPKTQQEVIRLMRDVQVNQELYTAMLNQVQQLQVARAGEVGNARIVDHATPPLRPVEPQKSRILALSMLLGLFGGVGLVLVRKALNGGIEDPALIESRLGLPVIATIPHSEVQVAIHRRILRKREAGLLAAESPQDLAVEAMRSLRTSLHFTMLDAPNNAILISGPSMGIGKSFVSSNFAAVLAQPGARVLLVDADLRKGHLHRAFGLDSREGGLSEILAGTLDWRKAVRQIPGIDLIPTGILPPNPSELLMGARLPEFLREACALYDHVILDAPPVLAVTDAVLLGKHVGATLLLAKSGQHALEEIREAMRRFEGGGIVLKGCIFNDVPQVNVGSRYYRYVYHYEYGNK